MKAYGGDTIRTSDGRVGKIVVSSFNLRSGETVYGIKRDCDTEHHVDMYSEADAPRRVKESEIDLIIQSGPHDYRPGPTRGYCGRCFKAKRFHDLP